MMKLSCAHLATNEMRRGRFLAHFCPCAGRVRGGRFPAHFCVQGARGHGSRCISALGIHPWRMHLKLLTSGF
jgi:hypothetical protein